MRFCLSGVTSNNRNEACRRSTMHRVESQRVKGSVEMESVIRGKTVDVRSVVRWVGRGDTCILHTRIGMT